MRNCAEITLERAPEAARRARRFVDHVCADWRLTDLGADAETIANELVENTLQHTLSMPHLVLEELAGALTVSVSDENSARAFVRRGGTHGGFGMLLVANVAADWGCTSHAAGGKTVWARLEPSPRCG